MHYFENIPTNKLLDKTIILDIDGTLVEDNEDIVSEKTKAKIKILSKNNYVMLCSNKKRLGRNRSIADIVGVPYIDTRFKKPSKKILSVTELFGRENIVVIGDKFLTDGLFALRIGAEFIKVEKLRGAKEHISTSIIYMLDDICYVVAKFFGYSH